MVPPLLCLLDCFLLELCSTLSNATSPMCVGSYLRNHPPSVLSPAQPRLPYPVNSQAHNCTSHVVSPPGIFRSVNVLAIQGSWGEEIKKLNKRVELKHRSLNLTKTLCYSLGLFWKALPKNRILFILRRKTENLPLVQQEGGNRFFGERGWQSAELQPNYAIPHNGNKKTLEWIPL